MYEVHCLLHRDWKQLFAQLALLRKLFLWSVTSTDVYYFSCEKLWLFFCLFVFDRITGFQNFPKKVKTTRIDRQRLAFNIYRHNLLESMENTDWKYRVFLLENFK